MKIEDIELVKDDERGYIWRCGPVNYIVRKKGTISGDHRHEEVETLFLVEGEIDLTIGDDTQKVKASARFFVPSNEYHKVFAYTDIKLIRGT